MKLIQVNSYQETHLPREANSQYSNALAAREQHKFLEERAAEYNGNLNLDSELDWIDSPVGNEIW